MVDVLLPGIAASRVETARAVQSVLHPAEQSPAGAGEAVLFVHGNVSSSVFWQQQLLALAEAGRHRALAVDLRGYGDAEPLPVDATRGVRDWSDDLAALVDALELDRVHLVGWSMGGGVVLQYLLDHPTRVASVALVAPVSPVRLRRHGRPRRVAGAPRRHRLGWRARPIPASSPRSPRATPPPTARSARARSCGRSTWRPVRCRWTPAWRTRSSPR